MPHVPRYSIFIALLVFGLLSSPATYRGGSAAAHPHMFLQLWHDAATGSFSHHAADDGHAHHHHTGYAAPASAGQSDPDRPSVSAFVVSDWGFSALLAPQPVLHSSPDPSESRRNLIEDFQVGMEIPPETPPPRF